LNTNDGKTFFPAFTSIQEAAKMKFSQDNSSQTIVRKFSEFSRLLDDEKINAEGVVINPSTDNIVISKSDW